MMKKHSLLVAVVVLTLLLSSCATPQAPASEGGAAAAPSAAGGNTFVGTPRNETLILDNLNGSISRPDFFNPYAPGVEMGRGYHEVCLDNLWEINTVTGDQFPALAAEMPKPLNADLTSFEIKLREGIYWDDGIEFTSDDVVYAMQLWLDNDKLPIHGWAVDYLKSVKATDKYTIMVDTTRPQPRFSKDLGVTIWDNRFWPVPKHTWGKRRSHDFCFLPAEMSGRV